MHKKVLTEVDLYTGEIQMPKGFDIDRDKIRNDIIESFVKKNRINTNPQAYAFDDYVVPYSQPLQWMQDYVRDHWRLDYNRTLVQKNMHGNVMHPKEKSWTRNQVEPVDLRNSPDYTLLYGVKVKDCMVKIHYEDNRRKGRSWDIPLTNNQFIMFPSTNMYYLTNNQKDSLNFVQTITYEYI